MFPVWNGVKKNIFQKDFFFPNKNKEHFNNDFFSLSLCVWNPVEKIQFNKDFFFPHVEQSGKKNKIKNPEWNGM